MRPFLCGLVSGLDRLYVCLSSFALWAGYKQQFLPDHLTCKFFMIRGETLLILGHGVKGQIWNYVRLYKTMLV